MTTLVHCDHDINRDIRLVEHDAATLGRAKAALLSSMREARRLGATYTEIAERTGMERHTVARWIKS